MNSKNINRRRFLVQTASGAGVLGKIGLAGARAGESRGNVNVFAYDVGKYSTTDPKLIGYEEVGRFPAGTVEPRRIAMGPGERLWIWGSMGNIRLLMSSISQER